MLEVIGQCVEAGDESGVKQLMNVLETLFILVSRSVFPPKAQFVRVCCRKHPSLGHTFLYSRNFCLGAVAIAHTATKFAS